MREYHGDGLLRRAALSTCLILLMPVSLSSGQAAQATPVFTSEGIDAFGRSAKVLAPGMILMLYGSHLSPEPICGRTSVQPALEICSVRVLIDSTPAELLYVSSGQINFRIPTDVPSEGFADLRVCVGSVCSTPVPMFFSTCTASLSLEKPAYVHMPVWIHVDPPPPYSVSYPCRNGPYIPPGNEFEVRRDNTALVPIPQPSPPKWASNLRCDNFTSRGSFPLHLLYRFDDPGTYSVRFTATKEGRVLYQSQWTDIIVEPYSEQQREAWLSSLDSEIKTNSYSVVTYTIPSLLAWPDERALRILLKIIPVDLTQCTNFDCIKLFFGTAALAWFDNSLLRAQVPPDRLLRLCPPIGTCK